jgi:hypothetical protein
MARLRDKLKLIGEDVVLIGTLGIAGTLIFAGLEYATGWVAANSAGDQRLSRLSISVIEYLHFGWNISIALLFVVDSVKTAAVSVIGSWAQSKKDEPPVSKGSGA